MESISFLEIVLLLFVVVLGVVLIVLLLRSKSNNSIVSSPAEAARIAALEATLASERAAQQRAKTDAELLLQQTKDEARAALAEAKSAALSDIEKLKNEHIQALALAKDEAVKAAELARNEQERRHQEAMTTLRHNFDAVMEKMQLEARAATDELLRRRQEEFSKSSELNLGTIVNPLRETIENMKKTMTDSTTRQTEIGSAMEANIKYMIQQSEAARKSADELARVFKHQSKVQGDWGETVLTELLESQGLKKGFEFDVQTSLTDANGNVIKSESNRMLRPDLVLHLDKQRDLIVDSKVSLTAFFDYVNAETDEAREKALKEHIMSLSKHVDELAAKDYSRYVAPPKTTVGYVIMFVPHTGALWTALNAQPDFWRKAMEKNVYIADEQTLYAALRIVKLTWTNIEQAQNQQQVFAIANEIIERVGLFSQQYAKIGKAISSLQTSYEDAEKKLAPGGRSITTSCQNLIKLGAKQSQRNPIVQLQNVDSDDVELIETSSAGTAELLK